jgi:hypothetical protein
LVVAMWFASSAADAFIFVPSRATCRIFNGYTSEGREL